MRSRTNASQTPIIYRSTGAAKPDAWRGARQVLVVALAVTALIYICLFVGNTTVGSSLVVSVVAQSTPTPTPSPSPTPIPPTVISCAADLTFGDRGRATTDFAGGLDRATAVAVQSDGKIVAAGQAGFDFALVRLNADGSLDMTFGVGGRVYTDFFRSVDSAEALVIQPDGKIVVAGSVFVGDGTDSRTDFGLARYNADGSLDTGFGIGGRVTTDFANSYDDAYAVALQSDGRIVVAGTTGGNFSFSVGAAFGLTRYNTDGSLDTTFGTGGRVTTDFGRNGEQANAVAIQADGKIVAVGESSDGGSSGGIFALARYNTNGLLDTAFGTGGKVTTDLFGGSETANAVAIQPDGKIVVAGKGYNVDISNDSFVLARYNANGNLDSTFSGDGLSFITNNESRRGEANGVAIQPDGKIVAAGYSFRNVGSGTTVNLSYDFTVVRLTPNGAPDTTFDVDGVAVTDFFFNDQGQAVALQPDGRIVVAGYTNTGGTTNAFSSNSQDFALARYNPNGSPDTTFDVDGKLSLELFYSEEQVIGLGQQSNGKIVAAGNYDRVIISLIDNNFQLARYNTNGGLDITFGVAGRVTTDFSNNSYDIARAIVILPDDRILVGGRTGQKLTGTVAEFFNSSNFALARYNPNGTLDTTFDGDGLLITDFNNTRDEIKAMLVQPDGKIVVGGIVDFKPALVRYTANGSLDSTFGSGGRVTIPSAMSVDAIARQPDGKIVAAGSIAGSGNDSGDFALTRYNSNGSPDDGTANDSSPGDSFGTNGFVTTDLTGAPNFDGAQSVVIQADGRIVAAGDISIARYNADGSLDTSFDVDGKATTNISISALALQADGKILATGVGYVTQGSVFGDFALVRFNTNGSLDTTICTGGAIFTDFFGSYDGALSIIIGQDGKPVLGGYANTGGSTDFALARYNLPTTTSTPTTIQFAAATYTVSEGLERNTDPASLTVNVTRTGDLSGAASVEYRTVDLPDAVRCDVVNGTSYHRCDYATTRGTLRFAAGESAKIVSVFITDDAHVEGNETFRLVLENPTGATLGSQSATTVTILDNDSSAAVANPIDSPEFFTRQHYVDFLSRAPEPFGFNAWLRVLNNCGAGAGDRGRDPLCDRIIVSTSFFWSDEFMRFKGFYVYRFYVAAFGRRPTYQEFARDLQRTTGATGDDTLMRHEVFATEFTERPEFRTAYDQLSLTDYVNRLFQTAELGSLTAITREDGTQLTRTQLADGSRTRPTILHEIVDSREVAARHFNRAFVAAQYFGYLRRDPEEPGYTDWVRRMDADPQNFRQLVNGFINAPEYRLRFGDPNR